MAIEKRLLNTPLNDGLNVTINLYGTAHGAVEGELLVEAIDRALPQRKLPTMAAGEARRSS